MSQHTRKAKDAHAAVSGGRAHDDVPCGLHYHDNHKTLFALLEASLPFAEWGLVEVDCVDEHGVDMRTKKLYPGERRGGETRPLREIVLFIGTRFSNLYTSVHTPA
jgi:hypothetical protein